MEEDIFPVGLDFSGGPPYGQMHCPNAPTYEDLLGQMSKANQVGDTDYLFEGDLIQGIVPQESEGK